MERQFELLEVTRKNVLQELEDCSTEALFEIPKGYNNNIVWNAVHTIVTQQLLVYGNANTPFRIEHSIIDAYRKGTTPTMDSNLEMVKFAKQQLLGSVVQLKKDYNDSIFGEYNTVTTSYNAILTSIEDAICFVNLHDAMHYGQIKMLKKIVQK